MGKHNCEVCTYHSICCTDFNYVALNLSKKSFYYNNENQNKAALSMKGNSHISFHFGLKCDMFARDSSL